MLLSKCCDKQFSYWADQIQLAAVLNLVAVNLHLRKRICANMRKSSFWISSFLQTFQLKDFPCRMLHTKMSHSHDVCGSGVPFLCVFDNRVALISVQNFHCSNVRGVWRRKEVNSISARLKRWTMCTSTACYMWIISIIVIWYGNWIGYWVIVFSAWLSIKGKGILKIAI